MSYHMLKLSKDANVIANSGEAGQTAPRTMANNKNVWVCTVCPDILSKICEPRHEITNVLHM